MVDEITLLLVNAQTLCRSPNTLVRAEAEAHAQLGTIYYRILSLPEVVTKHYTVAMDIEFGALQSKEWYRRMIATMRALQDRVCSRIELSRNSSFELMKAEPFLSPVNTLPSDMCLCISCTVLQIMIILFAYYACVLVCG